MIAWRIRRAEKSDGELLAALERDSFPNRSWGGNSLRESFDAKGVVVLLGGETDALSQGFALWRDLGGEAELLTIGVLPAAREKGLGEALLKAVIDGARDAGCNRIFLEVDEGNAAARALYRRFGFSEDGLRKAYYRDGANAVLMSVAP
jgi:ribosomal-protein-alanine N-acetyltransferase